jgi:beta-phosphoglucomutase
MLDNLLEFDAYLFDLDGTLINTEPLHHAAWEQTVEHHGFRLNWSFEEYLSHALLSRPHLFKTIYQKCPGLEQRISDGEELRRQKIAVYEELLVTSPPQWMPGAQPFLELLKARKKEMVMVTNSPKKHVEQYTHCSFGNYFNNIFTIEDFEHPKPHPAGYLKAINSVKKPKKSCLVFEDSLKGIQSAQSAGVKALLIASTMYKKSASVPDSVPSMDSFSQLLNCLK